MKIYGLLLSAIFVFVPVLVHGGDTAETDSIGDFYITITADDLYLCGEGFGGMYGCIDEAISREATSVVISASSEATVYAVQEAIRAVHAIGFEQVGFATFDESGS